MISLKEFLKKPTEAPKEPDQQGNHFPVEQRRELTNSMSQAISRTSLSHLPGDKVGAFSDQVAELATSDEVMDELSDALGTPKSGETEDEFVARAKATMTAILNRKLSK